MALTEPALFRRFPSLYGKVPWTPLGQFPTGVERVRGLVNHSVELWVKREDESGGTYGGNKVHELEFLLAEAKALGKSHVATLGAVGSNHVLATAIYGRQLGFSVSAVVFPQPFSVHVKNNVLSDVAVGAELQFVPRMTDIMLASFKQRHRANTMWIAPGGSSPVGTLGWVSAGCELREQIQADELPPFDVVYVALGSCGTAAGLLLSLGPETEVVGVRVAPPLLCNKYMTKRLMHKTEALLAANGGPSMGATEISKFRVNADFLCQGYGAASNVVKETVLRADDVGLSLETTYTGKALAALCADAQTGRLNGKRVLFIHTFQWCGSSHLTLGLTNSVSLSSALQDYLNKGGG